VLSKLSPKSDQNRTRKIWRQKRTEAEPVSNNKNMENTDEDQFINRYQYQCMFSKKGMYRNVEKTFVDQICTR
jgi:hypothetical protein